MNLAVKKLVKKFNDATFGWLTILAFALFSLLTLWQLQFAKAENLPLTPPITSGEHRVCAQVITRACKIGQPSECRDFPNPCSIPEGWTTGNPVQPAASLLPTPSVNPSPVSSPSASTAPGGASPRTSASPVSLRPVIDSVVPGKASHGEMISLFGRNFNAQTQIFVENYFIEGGYGISYDGNSISFYLTKSVYFQAGDKVSIWAVNQFGTSDPAILEIAPTVLQDVYPTSKQQVIAPIVDVTPEKPEVLLADTNFDSTINVSQVQNGVLLDGRAISWTHEASRSAFFNNNIAINQKTPDGYLQLQIPINTVVSGAVSKWTGFLAALTKLDNSSVSVPAEKDTTVSASNVVEVGADNIPLKINRGVRIVLPNQAGKLAGFIKNGQFQKIINTCSSDSQEAGDKLPEEGECKIDSGKDLVIWTKHFTQFVTYTQAPVKKDQGGPKSDSGSGNSAGSNSSSSGSQSITCIDTKPQSAPKLVKAVSSGQNSVTLTWEKAKGPVTYYLLAYGTTQGKMEFGNPNIGGSDTTSYTVKALDASKTYHFRVRAGNHCQPGDFSNEASVKVSGATLWASADGFQKNVLAARQEPSPTRQELKEPQAAQPESATIVINPEEVPQTGLLQAASPVVPSKMSLLESFGKFMAGVLKVFTNL